MGLVLVFWATAIGAYGVWYGLFAKEFRAVRPWSGRTKYRYRPSRYLRALVVAGSLAILAGGVAEVLRMWRSR
jgi:hypothetical protein